LPSGIAVLREAGHEVLVEAGAGIGSSICDCEYLGVGGHIVESAEEVWQHSNLVVKVKEPQVSEYDYLRPGLVLFAYLHLAPLPELTEALVASRVTAIAYETICEEDGSLPLLVQ